MFQLVKAGLQLLKTGSQSVELEAMARDLRAGLLRHIVLEAVPLIDPLVRRCSRWKRGILFEHQAILRLGFVAIEHIRFGHGASFSLGLVILGCGWGSRPNHPARPSASKSEWKPFPPWHC